MATIELTEANFEDIITKNDMILLDFWASWCGPCRAFAPVFEAASEKHPDIVFAKVNTEEQRGLAGHFNIRSIPTLMIFREKIIIFSQAGSLPGHVLDEVIQKAKALDMNMVRDQIAAQQSKKA
jgi:thioredoxin 1